MTNPSPSKSFHSSTVQPELLYGNGTFLVRLWTIPAGQQATLAPLPGQQDSQLFLSQGKLNISGPAAPASMKIGQRVVMQANAPALNVQNPGPLVATLLEIIQGQNLPPVPLPEVTEVRPWGSFTVLKDEPEYKLKQLINTPGNRLSLQRHQQREEHWIVIAGNPEITLNDTTHHLRPGEYIHLPLHCWHRLSNPSPSAEPVEVIELQLGSYFGEDDIERRQDDYGRA
jgi:mannose-6-phosphate isomerase